MRPTGPRTTAPANAPSAASPVRSSADAPNGTSVTAIVRMTRLFFMRVPPSRYFDMSIGCSEHGRNEVLDVPSVSHRRLDLCDRLHVRRSDPRLAKRAAPPRSQPDVLVAIV